MNIKSQKEVEQQLELAVKRNDELQSGLTTKHGDARMFLMSVGYADALKWVLELVNLH